MIATDCTGSRDAIVSGITGILVPPGHPDSICEAVVSLLRDPDTRQRLSVAARTWVAENFEDRRVLGTAVSFYRNLITLSRPAIAEAEEEQPEAVTGLPASM